MDTFKPNSESSAFDGEQLDRRRFIEHCWREAWRDYRAAGAPFGASQRAFELWIRFAMRTTRN